MLDFSKNYFELFDLPMAFALDAKRLAERYLTLQAATHPDRFSVAAGHERSGSRQESIQVNRAYRTLKDPLARARYLLGLLCAQPVAAGAASRDGSFYLEQMELREALAEARNGPNPRSALARVLTALAERSAALDKALDALFAHPNEANLAAAQDILRKLEFLDRCRRDAEAQANGR